MAETLRYVKLQHSKSGSKIFLVFLNLTLPALSNQEMGSVEQRINRLFWQTPNRNFPPRNIYGKVCERLSLDSPQIILHLSLDSPQVSHHLSLWLTASISSSVPRLTASLSLCYLSVAPIIGRDYFEEFRINFTSHMSEPPLKWWPTLLYIKRVFIGFS